MSIQGVGRSHIKHVDKENYADQTQFWGNFLFCDKSSENDYAIKANLNEKKAFLMFKIKCKIKCRKDFKINKEDKILGIKHGCSQNTQGCLKDE